MSFGAADPELYQLADQYDGVAGPVPANAAPEPMPAPEVQQVDPSAGLGGFDVDAASQNLGAVGQPQSPGAPPPEAVTTAPEAAPVQVDPLSVAPPQAPALTGDPAKDTQANLQYQRDLTAHFGAREQEIQKRAQGEHAKQAAGELAVLKEHEAERRKAQAARLAQRVEEQKYIDETVKQRAEAHGDLEGANWADKHAGAAAVATIFGAIGQGFMNAAMIQSGHAPTAENEGVKTIDRLIQRDYQVKKDRIASMSESLLEARHGFKDNEENFRAAMNDLDADTSAKYKLVAKEAEARLRQQGASDDDIKQDAIVRNAMTQSAKAEGAILDRQQTHRDTQEGHAATNKLAEAHLGLQERQIDATQSNHADTAAIERGRLALARTSEADAHADRVAAREEKAAEKNTKATVGSVRQNAVLGNLAEAEKAAADIGPVSEKSIRLLQTNEEKATAAKHSAESGIFGNVMANTGRALGMTPRGRYEGIPPEEQKKITASDQVITHLTEMQQGKNLETLDQYRDRYSPYVPGLSIEEVRRREAALPGLVAEQRAIQDPNGEGRKRTGGSESPTPKQKAAMERLAKEYGLTPVTP